MKSASDLAEGWGFGAWIEQAGNHFLFDAGGDGQRLASNIEKANLPPGKLKAIVLSHRHWDHVNGLIEFKELIPGNIPVYVPAPERNEIEKVAGNLNFIENSELNEVFPGLFISPPIQFDYKNEQFYEQMVILQKRNELVLITGCCHPGPERLISLVKELFPHHAIRLITGGLHMAPMDRGEILHQFSGIRESGVSFIAPSHCSGDEAVKLARESSHPEFVRLFLGDSYTF